MFQRHNLGLKMEVEQLKEEKKMLEYALTHAIGKILGDFSLRTDIYPDSISVNMVDVSEIGRDPKSILSGVSVDITI